MRRTDAENGRLLGQGAVGESYHHLPEQGWCLGIRKWPLSVFAQASYSRVGVSRVCSGSLSWFSDQGRKTAGELRSMHELSVRGYGTQPRFRRNLRGWMRLTHSSAKEFQTQFLNDIADRCLINRLNLRLLSRTQEILMRLSWAILCETSI